MIITAFDLATATGVCDGPVGGEPRVWSWYLDDAGLERPARLCLLSVMLVRYFASQPCDAVVYEAPLPIGVIGERPGKRGMMVSEANVAFARGAVGVLESECSRAGKPVAAVTVMAARSSVLGWRTNTTKEKTKARVVRECKLLIKMPVENDNECDAYVCWQYACNKQNPRLAVACTPLFREPAPKHQPHVLIADVSQEVRDYCTQCHGPCLRRPRHGEMNI